MASREPEQGDSEDQNRWQARPVLAAALKLAVISIPILCSLGVAWLVSALMPASTGGTRWLYRGVVVVCALGAAMLAERGARRLLPMTTLLKLSLLFPDQAPSRFKVARRATSRQKLDQLAHKRDDSAAGAAASILSLLAALASHDKRTRGHAERVRVYTDLLGQQLRLSRDDQDRLRWGALLHDIGKLSVDPAILNKAGKPTDEEWAILRSHPEKGAQAAASLLGWLGEWGQAIAEHHERFDGSGYPAGRSGQEISRAGRMIAVVDAYEVMTAARSYKRPMSTLKAREELTRCAGTHFDPNIVRAFLAISLPRLLWATGPLSLAAQMPFLGALRDIATTVASAAAPAAAAAAGAVVVAAGGPAAPPPAQATLSATLPTPIHLTVRPPANPTPEPATSPAKPAPSPSTSVQLPVSPPPTSPAQVSSTAPAPVPTETAAPTVGPTPTPTPTPTPPPPPPPPPASPNVAVTGGPAATTAATDALVSFSVSDPNATVTCAADGGPATTCASPWSAIGLGLGAHTLTVTAANAGGSDSATQSWTVVAPTPIVSVTSGPAATTSSTSALVAFTVSDPAASVTCSLDGAAASTCSSPWSAAGLSPGIHDVLITAANAQGSGSAAYNWTVLPPAPVVAVTSGPASSTTATFASVSFTVSDPAAMVTCSLDGGSATGCSSPWTATGLALGSHTLVVSASNAGGSGSDSASWTVVSPPVGIPTVTIDSGPPAQTSVPDATVAFTVSDPMATVTCSLDGAPATACSSPWSTTGLAPGAHSLVVFATNVSGSGSDSINWQVINNAPAVTITSGPANPTHLTTASVAFAVTDSSATMTCSLDGGAATGCASPWSAASLAVGSHTLTVNATKSGKSGSASYSWTILPPPNVTITSGPANGSSNLGPIVSFSFTSDTAGATFQCSLDGAAFSACTSPKSLLGLLSTHTFAVRAVISGVTGPVQSRTFFVI